jgi:predicted nucleic acid-binding protein
LTTFLGRFTSGAGTTGQIAPHDARRSRQHERRLVSFQERQSGAALSGIDAEPGVAGIEAADAWIAATALLYGATLMTHNPKDYLGVPNLQILSCS